MLRKVLVLAVLLSALGGCASYGDDYGYQRPGHDVRYYQSNPAYRVYYDDDRWHRDSYPNRLHPNQVPRYQPVKPPRAVILPPVQPGHYRPSHPAQRHFQRDRQHDQPSRRHRQGDQHRGAQHQPDRSHPQRQWNPPQQRNPSPGQRGERGRHSHDQRGATSGMRMSR